MEDTYPPVTACTVFVLTQRLIFLLLLFKSSCYQSKENIAVSKLVET